MLMNNIDRAVDALNKGELVIMPTDTVYGLAANPNVPGALEKIYLLKHRDAKKSIPLLASGIEAVEKFGAIMGSSERMLAEKFWPGPLTLILAVKGSKEKEGFRIPDHDVARKLLEKAGGVLRVTSANESGKPPALTAEDAKKHLGDSVDIIIDDGPVADGRPSTVALVKPSALDSGICEIDILREGVISRCELESVVEQ